MTCIQVSLETGKVLWFSHRFKNFPQFVVIHIVKGFSVVNEAVDVFLEFLCFLYDLMNVGNWSLVPPPFINSVCTSGSSLFTYCYSLAWRILSITLLVCEMSTAVWWPEHSLTLLFFVIKMKTYVFQSCPNHQVRPNNAHALRASFGKSIVKRTISKYNFTQQNIYSFKSCS